MFGSKFGSNEVSGLLAGEADVLAGWADEVEEIIAGLSADDMPVDSEARHVLPNDLESIPPGFYLQAIVGSVDRSKLNGFDLVRLLQARERLISHCQAGSVADTCEMAYAEAGDADSDPQRLMEAFEFAADELRPALRITRRAADMRLGLAFDVCGRLPRVLELLEAGLIDLSRARVMVNGTAHLTEPEAGGIVDQVAERAPKLTTGQLAAWIRRLCVETDPEKAKKRVEHAREDRRVVIEPSVDGTGNVHLFDIDLADAKAIGRRINRHMISLRKDGDSRSHDNLRADILRDLILGEDPTNGGRGLLDIRVSLTTLAGLDEHAAEIPGLGPVVADVARQFADRYPKAKWQATITNDAGEVVDVVTTSRRPTERISRLVNAAEPVCTFPGCRMPAEDCDFDHLLPHNEGGPTSVGNGGPKCRHDHVLKDHGWTHQKINGQDIWTSPLGHTYTTERPP